MVRNGEIEYGADGGKRDRRGEHGGERTLAARCGPVACARAAFAVLQLVQAGWHVVLRPRALIHAWREPATNGLYFRLKSCKLRVGSNQMPIRRLLYNWRYSCCVVEREPWEEAFGLWPRDRISCDWLMRPHQRFIPATARSLLCDMSFTLKNDFSCL